MISGVLFWLAIVVAGIVAVGAGGLVVLNRRHGGRWVGSPELAQGTLAPPPETPNGVSTMAPPSDETHAVEPFPIAESEADAIARLEDIVASFPGTHITERGTHYLRAEARSRLFGFIDDIDILVQHGRVHVRSASRVGTSDMGVNRRRYETIRAQYERTRG